MFRFSVCLLSLLIVSCETEASLIWDYTSTDGSTTVNGQLTTDDGVGGVLGVGTLYSLISIDTVFVNLVDITTPASNWNTGVAPPFSTSPIGQIIGTSATEASLGSGGSNFIEAKGTGGINFIRLADPPDSNRTVVTATNAGAGNHFAIFDPTSTTFSLQESSSAVPEPSAFWLLSIAMFSSLILHRKKTVSLGVIIRNHVSK